MTARDLGSRTTGNHRSYGGAVDDGDKDTRYDSVNVAEHVSGNAVQVRDIAGDVVFTVGQPAKPVARVPRELPLDVRDFAGRNDELAALDRLCEQASGMGTVVISAVSGTAGVGKTALAVHWAHRSRSTFPDGDLYIDLQGYGRDQPVRPEDALAELLRSLVGPAEPIPATLSDRARLFRTLVAERRMLIVLDNARSVEQVRPLLPGAGSTFVLVTSRDTLTGLVVRDGATRVNLGLLHVDEAVELLESLVGKRAQRAPEAARMLCEWSALLPLALRITAEMVNARPDEGLPALAEELASAHHDRLDLLEVGDDDRTAVRTVFSWSYRHLTPAAARAFRFIAIVPVRDVDVRAVAALTGTGLTEARRAVTELERAHLVQPTGNGRMRTHDLLRSYAADLGQQTDEPGDRDAALERLFRYYVAAFCCAVNIAIPTRRSGWHVEETPVPLPDFGNSDVAWQWLRDEHQNFAAALGAIGNGLVPVWTLSAAEQLLGVLAQHSGDLPVALTHFEQAWRFAPDADPDHVRTLWLDQVDTLLAAGMPNKASVYLNNVLELLHAADVAHDRSIGQVEHVRAMCALLQSDYKCAQEAATEAVTRLGRVGDDRAVVTAELTLLRAEMSLARAWGDGSAAELLQVAEDLAWRLRALDLTDEADLALLWAARLAVSFGDVDAAEQFISRTAPPRDGTPLDHVVFRSLVLAELAAEQRRFNDALDCAESGLDRLLAAFDRYGATDLVRGAGLFGRELGDLAVKIALKRRHTAEEVLTWLERARAHLHRHQPVSSTDPAVADAVDDFIRITRTLQLQRVNGPVEAGLAEQHEIALQRVSRLGWWSTTCIGSNALIRVDELADALQDSALIEFVISGDALAAVVVAAREKHLVKLSRASAVVDAIRLLRSDQTAMAPDHLPPPLAEVIAESTRRRLDRLDTQLIRPLLPIIEERDLVIVPAGQLYAVPWNSLPSLHRRPVVVAPSATAWLRALTAAENECAPGGVVIVVGPGVGAAAADERLAGRYRGAVTFRGDDATVATVLGALRTCDLLHVVAHGEHEPDNALFSRLELADAPLFAHHLGRLGKPPRQVVLAACGLALHDIRPGDELLGFAGALLSVGTSTVIVAVNNVGELAARRAMEDFHRALLNGQGAAAALADAVAGDPLRRPFVCIGADSTLAGVQLA
ncbi:CHAT domain-containing protein [Lentzea waywayandensis]|uniref:CHAT domain-containing protein n=1 Tax=Lentzea waywayandensis TaxID=84724 RepID=A0A1I6DE46_9PSEU|nr:CHAT domain-containing protein [Lentzea waywayandensis]SFR03641.1 CHAT domain-containing protein [Lentzea waywayandensis]